MSKEDTWRALKDQSPIMKWRCRLGWHRWTTYTVHERNHDFGVPMAKCECADCKLPRYEHPYTKSNKHNA